MTELVVDALPSQKKPSNVNDYLNIDLEVLRNVEKDLEDYEKLSLLFLILEDYSCFQELYDAFYAQNIENILSEFVGKIPEWQTKFLEALCITQGRRTISMLGKSFDELERIYVPIAMNTDPRGSIRKKVHLGAKLLFRLFDNVLGDDERARLLENVYKDIERPEGIKDDDDDGMEMMHALWWVEKGFITLSSDGFGDFQKLLIHLKKIGLCEHTIYSDMQKYTRNCRDKIHNPPPATSQGLQSQVLTQNINKNPIKPTIPSKSRTNTILNPLIIIINIITVPNTQYEDRDSSNVDVMKLESTLNGLGYNSIKIYNNSTENDIKKIFRDLKNHFKPKKFDGLIVCILSHGIKNHFVTHDNVEVPLELIDDYVCIPELQKLPKIVMVQACQGNKIPRAVETIKTSDLVVDGLQDEDKSININNHNQFLIFSSTMRECQSVRHKKKGSWFIEAVCEVLKGNKKAEDPLSVSEWTREVKKLVKDYRGELKKGLIAAQLPEVLNERFDDEFYFPNYRS